MCYKYDGRHVAYAAAQSICKAAGGDLAMPKTQADLNNVIAVRNAKWVKTFYLFSFNSAVQKQNGCQCFWTFLISHKLFHEYQKWIDLVKYL